MTPTIALALWWGAATLINVAILFYFRPNKNEDTTNAKRLRTVQNIFLAIVLAPATGGLMNQFVERYL